MITLWGFKIYNPRIIFGNKAKLLSFALLPIMWFGKGAKHRDTRAFVLSNMLAAPLILFNPLSVFVMLKVLIPSFVYRLHVVLPFLLPLGWFAYTVGEHVRRWHRYSKSNPSTRLVFGGVIIVIAITLFGVLLSGRVDRYKAALLNPDRRDRFAVADYDHEVPIIGAYNDDWKRRSVDPNNIFDYFAEKVPEGANILARSTDKFIVSMFNVYDLNHHISRDNKYKALGEYVERIYTSSDEEISVNEMREFLKNEEICYILVNKHNVIVRSDML